VALPFHLGLVGDDLACLRDDVARREHHLPALALFVLIADQVLAVQALEQVAGVAVGMP
jgi:hypothetical protein